ncbi:MAG: hypothetical protein JXR52_02375 [Bacteroidales bacterium]|nr:hypothetical protein [Bacteroidales bacterium]
MKNLKLLFVMLAALLFAVSCDWEEDSIEYLDDGTTISSAYSFDIVDWNSVGGTAEYHDLIGGQTLLMGSVAVKEFEGFLYVKFSADPGYLIVETHLQIDGLPINKKGNPVIGAFDYANEIPDGAVDIIYKVNKENLPISETDLCVDVFAHAVVVCAKEGLDGWEIDYDLEGNYVCEETAWGGGGRTVEAIFACKGIFELDGNPAGLGLTEEGTKFAEACSWGPLFSYVALDLENLPASFDLSKTGTVRGALEIEIVGDDVVFTVTGVLGHTLLESYLYVGPLDGFYELNFGSTGTGICPAYWNYPYQDPVTIIPLEDLPESTSSELLPIPGSTRWGYYFSYCFSGI